jgi:lysophospholipase L1-like esterase
MLLGACTSAGASTTKPGSSAGSTPASSGASATGWNLLAIGDSIAHPSSCDGCTDFVTLFAREIEKATGVRVRVENRAAVELSNVPGGSVTSLHADILTDQSLREAIRQADIIVISIGFNDTPWGRLDDPCDAAPNFPVVHWSKLSRSCISRVVSEYKYTLDQILTEIDQLRGCGAAPGVPPCSQRGHKDTMLRIVTVYNATIGDAVDPGWDSPTAVAPTVLGNNEMVHAQCEVIRFHGGRCADVYHLFNGPRGRKAAGSYLADFTHLSQRGHDAVAEALITLGLSPLR